MRVVIQKVDSCVVIYKEEQIRSISEGYVMYVGIERGDSFDKLIKDFENLFSKLISNEIDKDVLILSQFTLFADLKKNKPNFHHAEVNYIAKDFFYKLVEIVKNKYKNNVQSGIFGEFLNIKYTGKDFNTTLLDFNF